MKKLFLIYLVLISQCSIAQSSKYVWIDEKGEGRQVFVYFRNEVVLNDKPLKADINLYASSRYALYVNGVYVNFGPIRSYPQHPYYDTYDIQPFLQSGKNVIAAKVLINGMETFQLPFTTGSFISWGEITDHSGKSISLTTPGNWICRQSEGYYQNTPRFSFAKGAIEVFDARMEPDAWNQPEIDAKAWKKPVLLKDQKKYGELKPRTIPHLTQDDYYPKFFIGQKPIIENEKIIHYNLTEQDALHGDYGKSPAIFAYTYIFSPNEQDVPAGLSWGEYWLNGQPLKGEADKKKPFRQDYVLKLNAGWNYLFCKQKILWGGYDFMMAIPKDAEIALSPVKKKDDEHSFAVAGPLTPQDEEKLKDIPTPFKDPEKSKLTWKFKNTNQSSVNPPKEVAWLDYGKEQRDSLVKNSNWLIPVGEPQALTFDMGKMMLGRIFLEVDAPEGAIFDVTWSEDLRDSSVSLYKRIQINAGARFISRAGAERFETFKPYGVRFIQIAVRNHTRPVTLKRAGVVSQIYPYKKEGSFTCSDPMLNAIWELGWRTLQVCSEDSYVDTPFRERGHYAGDMFPQYAITLATSGDTMLVKHTIRVINDMYEKVYKRQETTRHEDYPIINILVASWYIRLFQDVEFAKELYPTYSEFLNKLYEEKDADGVYHPARTFFEWIQVDKSSSFTYYQTIVFAAYKEMAWLSSQLNMPEQEKHFMAHAAETRQMINKKFWNEENGRYYDGLKDGKYLTSSFPNSSSFPVIYDVATSKEYEKLENYFPEVLSNIGPPVNRKQLTTAYGGYYLLATLYKYENAAFAENYMRRHWGKMIKEADDTAWEDFNRDNHSTMSHAWSASPTYFLSTQVLGVQLGFPGDYDVDTVHIFPQSENLDWAEGAVPHPRGLVKVSWKVMGKKLFLSYSAPVNVPVKIKPKGRLAKLELVVNKED